MSCSAREGLNTVFTLNIWTPLDPIYSGLVIQYRYCIYWKYVVFVQVHLTKVPSDGLKVFIILYDEA